MSGTVVRDEDGTPLGGVRVRVCDAPFGTGASVAPEVRTRADGGFTVHGVPLRRSAKETPLFVEFTHAGRAREVLGFAWRRPDRAPPPAVIRLSAGTSVVGRVRRGPDVPRRAALTVGVLREDPRCGADAHPAVPGYGFDVAPGWSRVSSPTHVRARSDGTFRIDGVPAGAAFAIGARAGDGDPLVPTSVVRTRAGRTSRVTLRVRRQGAVVVLVTDADGRPLRGALVCGASQARTDARGAAAVTPWTGRSAGRIEVSCRGFAPAAADVPWTVRGRGARPVPLALRLTPGAALRGRIADASGRPFARVRVGLWPFDALGVGAVPLDVRTNADGRFEVRNVAPGRWQVSAHPRGHVLTTRTVAAPHDDAGLRVERAGSIAARLVAPAGTRLPPRVQVLAPAGLEVPPGASGPRDASPFHLPRAARIVRGTLVLNGVPPGACRVAVWAPGFAETTFVVLVRPGARADAGEVHLSPAAGDDAPPPEWVNATPPASGGLR